MPTRRTPTIPTPLAAALGIVPTVIDAARRLPVKAVQLPVLAVSTALTALETARKEYDDLAGRGERLVARLRGSSLDGMVDGLEDGVDELLHHTPMVLPYEVVGETVTMVSDLLDRAAERKPRKPAEALPLPGYDEMTLGSLRGRLRSLSLEQLGKVRDYEVAHAHRPPVVTLLENRIAKLEHDAAASVPST